MPRLSRSDWYDLSRDTNWTFRYVTAQLLSESGVDTARNRAWAAALARYAIAARPENLAIITEWVGKWQPAADSAVAGLAGIFTQAPVPASPESAVARVTASLGNLKEEIRS